MYSQVIAFVFVGTAVASPFWFPRISESAPFACPDLPFPTGTDLPFPTAIPFPTGTGPAAGPTGILPNIPPRKGYRPGQRPPPFPTDALPPGFPLPSGGPSLPIPTDTLPPLPPNPDNTTLPAPLTKRTFTFPLPPSSGTQTFPTAKSITGTFDGGLQTYGRGVTCTGQTEGATSDAVFILEDGATLKNAIIGADQREGVHCLGACTVENVWWSSVCEDALTLKGDGDAVVRGGGARGAEDKVVQHNGAGTVTIDGFAVEEFGKLYRSCGNCKGNGKARHVVIKNVKASSGKVLAGINSNYGDTATIESTCASSVQDMCVEYKGTSNNDEEPGKIGSGPSNACKCPSVPAC